MTIKNGDLPAMPFIEESKTEKYNGCSYTTPTALSTGLTKREMFAMAAMQGFCCNPMVSYKSIAECAVETADALLAELERTK